MVKKAKRPQARPGELVTLAPHRSGIPAHDGKPMVGREDVLRVSSVTGTGSARNPYRIVVTNGVHFWHLEPDDAAPVIGLSIGVVEKSRRQLDDEIEDALCGEGGGEVTVVAAWTEDVREIAPGQRSWRLGERPRLVDAKKAHAVMWTNRGTRADAARARAYVQKEHPDAGRVFVYPATEEDPLGRARRDVLTGLSGLSAR